MPKNYKVTIYNSATNKAVKNKNTETLEEAFDFIREHIVSTNKKAHLTPIDKDKVIVIRIRHADLSFSDDILIDQAKFKITRHKGKKMKPYKLQVCTVCGNKRKKGKFGAVLVDHIKLARKKLKVKGPKPKVNEFVCVTCCTLVKNISSEIVKKNTKTKKGKKRSAK